MTDTGLELNKTHLSPSRWQCILKDARLKAELPIRPIPFYTIGGRFVYDPTKLIYIEKLKKNKVGPCLENMAYKKK